MVDQLEKVLTEAKGLPAVFTRTFLVAYALVWSDVFEPKIFGSIEPSVAWLKALRDPEQ